MPGKITALVTVYKPDETIKNNIENIATQVNRVIVCDNSREKHLELFSDIANAQYLSKDENLGLPTAFNLALKDDSFNWAADEFIVFFDQDSQIKKGYINDLKHSYQKVEKKFPNIGCMGPVFFNTSNHTIEIPRIKTPLVGKNYKVDNVITSSMITRYKNLKRVNFWNDNLFLDFADWDLCWRMEKAGMLCVITEEEVLHHSVGSGEKKVGPIHLRVGAPFREYYQTRDAYYLLKENYIPEKMRLRLLANITIRPIVHDLFLENKKERKKYRQMGKQDYKKGIRGEILKIQ
jgi:rhamnosyltransferase